MGSPSPASPVLPHPSPPACSLRSLLPLVFTSISCCSSSCSSASSSSRVASRIPELGVARVSQARRAYSASWGSAQG
eukprot:2743651-Pyramimonas_sp.AAC.1